MRTWKLTETNDIRINGNNDIVWVEGDDELIQSIKERIFTNLGEWFLNVNFGFERMTILGKRPDLIRATEAVNKAILFDDRIRTVDDIKIDLYRNGRYATITFIARKQNDEIIEGRVSL